MYTIKPQQISAKNGQSQVMNIVSESGRGRRGVENSIASNGDAERVL